MAKRDNSSDEQEAGGTPATTTDAVVCDWANPPRFVPETLCSGAKARDGDTPNAFERAYEALRAGLTAINSGVGIIFTGGERLTGDFVKMGTLKGEPVEKGRVEDVNFVKTKGDGFTLSAEEVIPFFDGAMEAIRAFGSPAKVQGYEGEWFESQSLITLQHGVSTSGVGSNPPSYYGGTDVNALAWALKGIWGSMARTHSIANRAEKKAKVDKISTIQKDFGVSGKVTQKALDHPSTMALIAEGGATRKLWYEATNKDAIVANVRALVKDRTVSEAPPSENMANAMTLPTTTVATEDSVTPVAESAVSGDAELLKTLLGAGVPVEKAMEVAGFQ